MCFSATASFSASAVLLGAGIVSLTWADRPAERPFAAIPLFFAGQQFIEGVLWLAIHHDAPALRTAMTYAYVLFAHVLWPVYVPVAVFLIEPPSRHRNAIAGLAGAGAVASAWLLYSMLTFGVESRLAGMHIEYVSSHVHAAPATVLYVAAVSAGLLLSSHRFVQIFGAATLLSFAFTFVLYERWFISLWCFFAALLSALVLLHLRRQRRFEADAKAAGRRLGATLA